jgi:hypothetical protein
MGPVSNVVFVLYYDVWWFLRLVSPHGCVPVSMMYDVHTTSLMTGLSVSMTCMHKPHKWSVCLVCVLQAKGWEGMKMDLTIYNIVINSYAMEKDFAGAARY